MMNLHQDPYELFQKQLVSFANTKLGRKYLDFGSDIPNDKRIVQVQKNSLHFYDPRTEIITAQIRLGDDVDHKLKNALRVGSIAASALASMFSRPEFALNMILATKTLNTGAGNGQSQAVATGGASDSDGSWNEVHDFSTANFATASGSTSEIHIDVTRTDRFYITRVFLPVFLSIQRSAKVKGFPTLRLTVNNKNHQVNDANDWYNLVGPTTQASPTTLSSFDYDQCGAVNNPQELANRIALENITSPGNNTWTLNATGKALTQSSLNDWLMLGLREGHDALDIKITTGFNTGNSFRFRPAGYATSSQRPLLTVQYTSSSAFIGLI